jgi:hypothetical protein
LSIQIKYLTIVLFLLSPSVSAQQDFSNIRTKWIQTQDTVKVDSLSIFPSSIIVFNLDSSYYKARPFHGEILFYKDAPGSVLVSYKVLPLNLSQKVSFRNKGDTTLNQTESLITRNPYNFTKKELTRTDLFGGESLRKGGSISRGIRIGNNQDLSINSSMNLQLSGSFQGVEILAAITDNNIPIQPQGNTQTLQEFDKVYVQFSKNGHRLIAGDFQLKESKDAFLKFNKKAQGLSYNGMYKAKLFGEKAKYEVTTDAALSRGKFARNKIIGIEGNQGPYLLRGAENEQFIIILSGTERIYIDGKLMKRGMDNDYVIDYNTSEITFTTNQLITKDKRIVIEFQYSDQNYGRSLFHAGNEVKNSKGGVFFNLYSEQDMKFQQLQQSLSDSDLDLLFDVGDSLHFAITPKIDSVAYSANQVLYKKQDSIVDFVTYEVYTQSNNPDSAFYTLGFSNVGFGNGNYNLSTSTTNGRVYEWVAPILGVKQGSYEPLVQLVAPKQQQMATLGMEYKLGKNTNVFLEGAFSKNNQNLFSNKNKTDDQGIAANTRISNSYPFSKKGKSFQFKNSINYQIINKNFSRIERFKSIEFERDYNLSNSSTQETEHIASLKSDLLVSGKSILGINASFVGRGTSYNGLKTGGNVNLKLWKNANVIGKGSFLKSDGLTQTSNFYRHNILVSQKVKLFTFKVWEEQENNQIIQSIPDTLVATSFNYNVFGSSIGINNKRLNFDVNWNQRTDHTPFDNKLNRSTLANNFGTKFSYKGKKSTRFIWNTTFRELQILNSKLTTQQPENTLLNRLEYKFKLWNGMINSSSFFEVAAGSELKRQFAFIEVNPGSGTHMWNDFNQDSIQDLNEFVIPPAGFSDKANYVRVYLPSTEFVKTYSNRLNQSLTVSPAKYFNKKKKFDKFIRRFNDQLVLKLHQKNAKDEVEKLQIPFQSSIADTNLISTTSSFRNTLYFNRSNPKYGINYSYSQNENKSILTNGFEGRSLQKHSLDIRLNFLRMFSLRTKLEASDKFRTSELFSDQDYLINILELKPTLSFQKGSNFRVKLKSELKEKQNQGTYGGELARFVKIGSEVTYNLLTKGRMSVQMNYIETTFSGPEDSNSPLIFDMLEGFQVGTNFTWQARYQRNFKNNFQLSFQYEGRSSETSKAVHTGTMQVQLIF